MRVRKLNDVKILFNAKYGTPDFESEVCEDSLEFEKEAILYSWNIKYKKIEGTIEKSQSDMFFVNVVLRGFRKSLFLSLCTTLPHRHHASFPLS